MHTVVIDNSLQAYRLCKNAFLQRCRNLCGKTDWSNVAQ